jgi:hypothetical protein
MMSIKYKLSQPKLMRGALGIAIALFGVGFAIRYLYADLGVILERGIHLDLPTALIALLIQVFGLVLAILTWGNILQKFGADASTRDHFRIYLYSSLGWIIPGGIWNIIMRSTLYSNKDSSPEQVAAASLAERVIIGLSALVLYLLSLMYKPELNTFERPGFAILLAVILMISIQPANFNRIYTLMVRLSGNKLRRFSVQFRAWDLVRWLLIEGFILVLGGSSLFLLLKSLLNAPLLALPFVLSAWAAASVASNLFFWIPGTLIFHDGLFVLILSSILGLSSAILFTLLVRIWTTLSLVLFAFFAWVILDSPANSFFNARQE